MSRERSTAGLLPSALLVAGLALLIVGERVLGSGSAQTFASGSAALALIAALALRLRGLGRAVGDARAVEMRLLGCYAGIALALALYAFTTDAGLGALGLAAETRERVGVVLAVLWPAVLLVSLLGTLFVELVYARMPLAVSVELRRVRTALEAGLTLGLSVVFLMSMNYVANERDLRKDVSYFRTTHPSEGTRALVAGLDQKLEVILFWRRGSDVLGQVEPYFAELIKGAPKLSYKVMDVALAPELTRQHRVRENGQVLLVTGTGEEAKGRSFSVGEELTRARRELKKLDGSFQEAFRRLVTPERKLHLTVGHGERNARLGDPRSGDGAATLKEILQRLNLKSDDLGISQGLGSAVPDGATAVAIMGPTEKFMTEEANALLTYVRAGGRLLVMVDPGVETGLAPLLDGLGVEVQPGTAASEKHHMRRAFTQSDHVIVYSNRYSSHPTVTTVARHQRELASVFFEAAGLIKKAGALPDPKPTLTFPLSTDQEFWRDENANFARDPNEPEGRLNLVAAVTVPVPKAAEAQKEAGAAQEPKEGRAVIIGDGDFMTDKLARNPGNMLLFVDALAWLVGEERLGGEVSSEEDIAIEHSRDRDKIWFYATTFAVPFPVLLLGMWMARRRRRREVTS